MSFLVSHSCKLYPHPRVLPYSPNYKLTIGVDFALKNLDYDDKTKIALQLWDIAGHERFGHMTHVYYKYAIGLSNSLRKC